MRLHHRQAGAGAPLVLLHGLFGSLENLGAIARLLRDHFTVYSVDLPNHGRSPHASHMHLRNMAEAVASWQAEQGLERAHFVGHSLGGKVAMEMALNNGASIAKLAVIDIAPVTYSARHHDVFAGLFAVDPAAIRSREEADALLAEHVHEDAVRSFLLKNLVKTTSGFSWRMNLADLHQNYPNLIEGNRSGHFDGPTMFLKGGESDYITRDQQEEIVQRFPAVQLKVIPGTGHWLHAEKPELVATLLRKFFTL